MTIISFHPDHPTWAPGPAFGRDVGQSPLERAHALARTLHSRIDRLGLELWQQQVYGLIFINAFQTPPLFPMGNELQVRALLDKLEKYEATALIKLAVWKFECQMNPTKPDMTTLEAFLWFQDGWKEAKKTQKAQPSIDIISEGVQSFL